ncbi:MAG: NTP transferase domain-containing protein, partial [Phycisphaerae bacterium]
MYVFGVILARAGSKGLPDKCVHPLCGRPLIEYTFDHVRRSALIDQIVLTTDSEPAARIAREHDIRVVDRPAELATDTATVDAAARHAVQTVEAEGAAPADVIVLLYGNIPVRAPGIIDRVVQRLAATGADSVRTVAPVSKQHPDWLHYLDGDHMRQYRPNSIYRRQDLDPVYYHDAAVLAVKRETLFAEPQNAEDFHAFLGRDRRAVVQAPEDTVDVDTLIDLQLAEAILSARQETQPGGKVECRMANSECRMANGEHESPFAIRHSPFAIRRIGRHNIGSDSGVFIVAEAGVNHNGDEGMALRLVDAAVQAGADAVKFQVFNANA